MGPDERLEKARKLLKAYEALGPDNDDVIVIRLFVEAALDQYTVRRKHWD